MMMIVMADDGAVEADARALSGMPTACAKEWSSSSPLFQESRKKKK